MLEMRIPRSAGSRFDRLANRALVDRLLDRKLGHVGQEQTFHFTPAFCAGRRIVVIAGALHPILGIESGSLNVVSPRQASKYKS